MKCTMEKLLCRAVLSRIIETIFGSNGIRRGLKEPLNTERVLSKERIRTLKIVFFLLVFLTGISIGTSVNDYIYELFV